MIIGIERSDGSYVRPLGLVRFQPYDMVWIAGDRETIEQVLVGTKPPVPKTEKSSYGGFSARNDFVDKMSIKRHLIFYFSGVKPYFCILHKVYMDVT